MQLKRWAFALIMLTLLLPACGRKDVDRQGNIRLRGERPVEIRNRDSGDLLQEGIASWYGNKYHGRQTANGERYDMNGITAAHKTLPFNTWVRVVHQETKREVLVRINDRGPFIRGRIIDLSKGAAKKLGIIGSGTAQVKLYLANGPNDPNTRNNRPDRPRVVQQDIWTIQVGSYSERARAREVAERMEDYHRHVKITRHHDLFRVRVGKATTRREAEDLAQLIEANEPDIDTWILRDDD
jgi:rare lipoprotein A